MALQGEIILNNGIDMTSAYLVIISVEQKNNVNDIAIANITVLIFKDQEAKNSGKCEVTTFTHTCSGDTYETYFGETVLQQEGKTLYSQSYEFLKSLPTYQQMIDV